MGLLDTNITKILSQVKKGVIADSITDEMNISSTTYNIPCKGYNTCAIFIYNSSSSNHPIQITTKLDQFSAARCKIFDCTNVDYYNVLDWDKAIAHASSTSVYLVDVSAFPYVSVGKAKTDSPLSISYVLSSDTTARDYINNFYKEEKHSFTPTKAAKKGEINCTNYSTLYVRLNAKVSFSLPIVGGYTQIYCKELKMFVSDVTEIPAGSYTFAIDVSGMNTFEFLTSPIIDDATYTLSKFPFCVEHNRLAYYLNQTKPIGAGNWIKVPRLSKYSIVTIVNDTSTYPKCTFYEGQRTVTMVENTPLIKEDISLNYRDKMIDLDTNSLVTSPQIQKNITRYLFSTENIGYIAAAIEGAVTNVSIYFDFYESEMPTLYYDILHPNTQDVNVSDNELIRAGFSMQWTTADVDLYMWDDKKMPYLCCTMGLVWVWHNKKNLYISTSGIGGERKEIPFDETHFPGLMEGAEILHVVILPYSRNATLAFGGAGWRLNVMTSTGQIYHNFPSRSSNPDTEGPSKAGDEYLFDESVIWELPERWSPVKSKSGNDATLIATGKYRYYPGLPDHVYEFHPAKNASNTNPLGESYGNNGFDLTLKKGDYTFARFTHANRDFAQGVSTTFMGGFATNEKMCMLGTYRSNASEGQACRICAFLTNDGGRQWFCRYEFGSCGFLVQEHSDGHLSDLRTAGENVYSHDITFTGATPLAGKFKVKSRRNVIPSAEKKEPTKLFSFGEAVEVSSIIGNGSTTVVTTSSPHGLKWGEVIVFEKQGGEATEWDWIDNAEHTEKSAGNGVVFKAVVINDTSFTLKSDPHNPYNNLPARHIHSVDRSKDGYSISSGERYPTGGWVIWMPCKEADSYDFLAPWSNLSFIRLNSTNKSIYRTLGLYLMNDSDNTVITGIDDSMINLGDVALPEGRTQTFLRGSQGVYKGRLVDIDDLSKFSNILPTSDVCYGFKIINGTMIYIGQNKDIAVSYDYGKSWTWGNIPRPYKYEHCHFDGHTRM